MCLLFTASCFLRLLYSPVKYFLFLPSVVEVCPPSPIFFGEISG